MILKYSPRNVLSPNFSWGHRINFGEISPSNYHWFLWGNEQTCSYLWGMRLKDLAMPQFMCTNISAFIWYQKTIPDPFKILRTLGLKVQKRGFSRREQKCRKRWSCPRISNLEIFQILSVSITFITL